MTEKIAPNIISPKGSEVEYMIMPSESDLMRTRRSVQIQLWLSSLGHGTEKFETLFEGQDTDEFMLHSIKNGRFYVGYGQFVLHTREGDVCVISPQAFRALFVVGEQFGLRG